MEKIVYILGAGFSAPLGLPVMSNFLEKARDQYFAHPDTYDYFKEIEDEMNQIHKAANYYQTNVFNIEDILSILEFRAHLDDSGNGEQRLDSFKRYLSKVIEFYTPTNELHENPDSLFPGGKWNKYIHFVAAIMNCHFHNLRSPEIIFGYGNTSHIFNDFESKDHCYSVITFNYDLVLESVQEHFKNFQSTRQFHRSIIIDNPRNQIRYAKLHGSINNEIIPPTWNKGLNSKILSDWKVAYKALSEANQIRILGYSLPITDTYFRYMLRATTIDAPHLRWIDVICKDDHGSVKKSYDDFIKYPKYRFVSAAIEEYLTQNKLYDDNKGHNFFELEQAHETFFRNHYK
jgi:hypothetical protein